MQSEQDYMPKTNSKYFKLAFSSVNLLNPDELPKLNPLTVWKVRHTSSQEMIIRMRWIFDPVQRGVCFAHSNPIITLSYYFLVFCTYCREVLKSYLGVHPKSYLRLWSLSAGKETGWRYDTIRTIWVCVIRSAKLESYQENNVGVLVERSGHTDALSLTAAEINALWDYTYTYKCKSKAFDSDGMQHSSSLYNRSLLD